MLGIGAPRRVRAASSVPGSDPDNGLRPNSLMTMPTGVRTAAKNTVSRIRVFTHPRTRENRHQRKFGSLSSDGEASPRIRRKVPTRNTTAPTRGYPRHHDKAANARPTPPTLSPNERSVGLSVVVMILLILSRLWCRLRLGPQPDGRHRWYLSCHLQRRVTWDHRPDPCWPSRRTLRAVLSSLETLNMSGSPVVRLCVAHVLVLLLVSGAAAQTDPANAPAQTQSPISGGAPTPSPGGSPPPLAPDGFFREPLFLSTGIDFLIDKFGDGTSEPKSGFYPELSNMITGAGWVSVGPGYRKYLYDRHLLLDTSAAISWRLYTMGQGRVELLDLADGHLMLGAQAMWQDATQVNYFGIGPGAIDADQSQYQLQSFDFVGYATRVRERLVDVRWNVGMAAAAQGHAAWRNVQRGLSVFTRLVPDESSHEPLAAARLPAQQRFGDRRYARQSRPSNERRTLSGRVDDLLGSVDRRLQLPPVRG